MRCRACFLILIGSEPSRNVTARIAAILGSEPEYEAV